MAKSLDDMFGLRTPDWDFATFLRYFVPGLFTAFWVAIYIIRMTDGMGSKEILSLRSLLSYVFDDWEKMIGMIVTLGGFLGLLFVGIDPIIRAFMGSRVMNFVYRYLLSSKKIDFAYFQFMRLHDLAYRYERLPKMLFESSPVFSPSFDSLIKKDYSSRYFFRETIQNYFWDQCVDKGLRSRLTHRFQLSSLYLYLSFVSLSLFVMQVSFFVTHLLQQTRSLPVSVVQQSNYSYIPLILGIYVLLTFAYNLHYFKIFKRDTLHGTVKELRDPERITLATVSLVVFVALFYIIASKFKDLVWIESLDTILFVTFFLMFVSFYWASMFQYSRYVISFEHCFEQCKEKLVAFASKNFALIKDMNRQFSRPAKTDEPEKSKTSALLKALILLLLLFSSAIIVSFYFVFSNPPANEIFTLDYSEKAIRVLNLTAGDHVLVWLSLVQPESNVHHLAGSTMKFYMTDVANRTVLSTSEITQTGWLCPMSYVVKQNGAYVMCLDNSVGDAITKTIWLSYRVTSSVFGIPIEQMLIYGLIIISVLVIVVLVMILIRKQKSRPSRGVESHARAAKTSFNNAF